MSNEKKWRLVWAAWVGAFVVAETIALRSGDEKAPFSHHMRKALAAEKSSYGQVVMLSGTAWLHRHIFGEGVKKV